MWEVEDESKKVLNKIGFRENFVWGIKNALHFKVQQGMIFNLSFCNYA